MAPYTNIPLSPAELSYLHTSLSQDPPIRPDGRSPSQFRPLIAETDILPSANGSARVCFADGTEAIVGVKAEVEKSQSVAPMRSSEDVDMADDATSTHQQHRPGQGDSSWLELTIEIPGLRDDDALPVFLSAMLKEALIADGHIQDRLWMNARYHWRLYIDILLLSQPLSYPLPLLSLTTHLALLSTRLPALVSEKDEDPMFDDDWEAATPLYARGGADRKAAVRPPVTLLVMAVGAHILFDPSQDELAVADAVVAISAARDPSDGAMKLVALRAIDPPSRLTAAGALHGAHAIAGQGLAAAAREQDAGQTVWRPSRGGVARALITRMIKAVVAKDGVAHEVMDGLDSVAA